MANYPLLSFEHSRNWISTRVHMDLRGPCNNFGGPEAKHNKLGVHNDILGVHEENQLRTLFIF